MVRVTTQAGNKLVQFCVFSGFLINASVQAAEKTPSDVFSLAMVVKAEVAYLLKENGFSETFPDIPPQKNKQPRHVIQKALEILNKINVYRQSKGFGQIYIPPYPAREVKPADVYNVVMRLNDELAPFIDPKFYTKLTLTPYHDKQPNDVYRLLWSISLAFNKLLGIHTYTPTDVYVLSEKLVRIAKFLAKSQNEHSKPQKPPLKQNLHPNHALYAAYDFLSKVAEDEKRLWLKPVTVPKAPQRVITPTEVYDALQFNIAELQYIKYRLGLEKYEQEQPIEGKKSSSEVVQNIEYAKALLPNFSLSKPLIQYPQKYLAKTPSHVYSVATVIQQKLKILKKLRGISQPAIKPPYIDDLRPIHTYQKVLEATDKALRLKVNYGDKKSIPPREPLRSITPSEVYELALHLDGILTIMLREEGYKEAEFYLYMLNPPSFTDKTPSDAYYQFWLISNQLDILLGQEYTAKEILHAAKIVHYKVNLLLKNLAFKDLVQIKAPLATHNANLKQIFNLALNISNQIEQIKKRLNLHTPVIRIPKDRKITPSHVYNTLRILSASINELLIERKINVNYRFEALKINLTSRKIFTYEDVYQELANIEIALGELFDDARYQLTTEAR